jgi:hypothetical protein
MTIGFAISSSIYAWVQRSRSAGKTFEVSVSTGRSLTMNASNLTAGLGACILGN